MGSVIVNALLSKIHTSSCSNLIERIRMFFCLVLLAVSPLALVQTQTASLEPPIKPSLKIDACCKTSNNNCKNKGGICSRKYQNGLQWLGYCREGTWPASLTSPVIDCGYCIGCPTKENICNMIGGKCSRNSPGVDYRLTAYTCKNLSGVPQKGCRCWIKCHIVCKRGTICKSCSEIEQALIRAARNSSKH